MIFKYNTDRLGYKYSVLHWEELDVSDTNPEFF